MRGRIRRRTNASTQAESTSGSYRGVRGGLVPGPGGRRGEHEDRHRARRLPAQHWLGRRAERGVKPTRRYRSSARLYVDRWFTLPRDRRRYERHAPCRPRSGRQPLHLGQRRQASSPFSRACMSPTDHGSEPCGVRPASTPSASRTREGLEISARNAPFVGGGAARTRCRLPDYDVALDDWRQFADGILVSSAQDRTAIDVAAQFDFIGDVGARLTTLRRKQYIAAAPIRVSRASRRSAAAPCRRPESAAATADEERMALRGARGHRR